MTNPRKITIATRRSPLALWQANTVKSLLEQRGLNVSLNLVTTSGDKMQRGALSEVSLDDPNLPAHLKTGKGLFVKEVQEEILSGQADLAVHSMKDLPVEKTSGLRVAAVLPRANPSDVIIFSPRLLERMSSAINLNSPLDSQPSKILEALKNMAWDSAAPIGTTSARRQLFLRKTLSPALLPLVVLRGNVDTRLARVANNEFSFIMLARAGIDRLNLFEPTRMLTLPPSISTPAPAQGIVAIECREADSELRSHLAALNNATASLQAACERTLLWLTGGDCHTALAAFFSDGHLSAWAGKEKICHELSFDFSNAECDHLNSLSKSDDPQSLFSTLLASSIAERLHDLLTEKRFNEVMNLRNPKSNNGGLQSC